MRVTGLRVWSAALLGVLLSGAAANAAPTPTPNPAGSAAPTAAPKKGTPLCTITDRNAIELSGMVVSGDFIYAVNDSAETEARRKVFKFNLSTCALVGAPIGYPKPPLDPEDLAVDAQGTIWIADTGEDLKNPKRPTVALWKLAGDKVTGPFRLSYPDGKKYDAEAMVMGADGLPIIITKPDSILFVPTGPLQENSTQGVPMKQVGKLTLPKTSTPNRFGVLGGLAVTGGAISPDRTKVVLRTYADALEWTVAGNDIVKSITTTKPKITALPQEHWGEAITYSPDGKSFLTLSDMGEVESGKKNELLSYVPSTEDPNASPTPAAQANKPAPAKKSWWSSLVSSTDRLYLLIGSVGVLGALLVLFGIICIARSRKRRREEEREARAAEAEHYYDDQRHGYQDQGYGPPPGEQRAQGRVYGSPQYGYEDEQAYGGQQQHPPGTYGQAQPHGQPQTYGEPNYGYPDQGYDQGYGQPPYR